MNYSEVKEAELISLSRQGDNSAFDQLIKDNKQKVYLSVLSKKKNPDLAEEITQKAIIKAWKNIDKFQGKSTFYTWVYRISHNLIIDEYRKEQRRKEVSLDERMEEWGGSFEKKLEGVEPQGTNTRWMSSKWGGVFLPETATAGSNAS